jgi:hypothetical protein
VHPDEGSWVTSSTSTAILPMRTVRTLQRVVIPRWAVWRSYIQRNCRYFSFRASVSGLGFGPRVSPSTWAATSSTPWCVPELHNCTQLLQFESRSFKFKLLFIANATRSRSTFGGNMVEYHMVRGPKPRPEMIE